MGLKLTDFFELVSYEQQDTEVIICNECLTHLCLSSLVISDQFWGLSGDAFLVDRLINVMGENQERETTMRTGRYIIDNVKCLQCSTKLGWQYKKSFKYSEYYKEGKYVIEKKFIRQITNHSSTARLREHAKVLKRRHSSASIASNTTDDNVSIDTFRRRVDAHDYDVAAYVPAKKNYIPRASVLTFRTGLSRLLGRGHYHRAIGKPDLDEKDEDASSASLDF